ncbi:multicopper oxidase domain-containing protein [Methyloglobulus sp.]|uniref:multicopper oxidase family protein n=1 Tax=Methyloglobulus sp. TaxID=2518622 RepID=UPI0032B80A36
MPTLTPFLENLPIPDVVHPKGSGSIKHLSIEAQVMDVQLHCDLPPTRVWSYQLKNGKVVKHGTGISYLGPTIEVNRAQKVHVAWENDITEFSPNNGKLPYEVVKLQYTDGTLPIPQNEPGKANALPDAGVDNTFDRMREPLRNLKAALVTHLHGGRTQADSDGWADDTAIAEQTAYCIYHGDQAATMLWYHDHANHVTRLNVFAGLAGVWLIRDDEEESLGLPSGDFELPLVIQDRNLDLDGAGNFTGALLHKTEVIKDPNKDGGPAEFFGPYTLVNGKIWPKARVEPTLYRLRVLNGSNARTYRLMLIDDQGSNQNTFVWQIGCDQGLLEKRLAIPPAGLVLMPGERADLLVDFSNHPGQQLYLWNTAEAPFSNDPSYVADPPAELNNLNNGNIKDAGRRPYPQIMRFDVKADTPNCIIPPDQMRQPSPNLIDNVDDATKLPIRLMALVEKPADPAIIDDIAMLVFWEYVENTPKTPAPPGAEIVSFTYVHPKTKAIIPAKQYWKAAEEFYDKLNWEIHLGDTEQWYIVNVSPDTHPVHVHLVDMYVNQRYQYTLTGTKRPYAPSDSPDFPIGKPDPDNEVPDWVVDGKAHLLEGITATTEQLVDPDQTGPKDTVRINPGEMIGVAMKFSPFCGRYIYHCHILEHEDHDMMRPFVIVPDWIPHHEN